MWVTFGEGDFVDEQKRGRCLQLPPEMIAKAKSAYPHFLRDPCNVCTRHAGGAVYHVDGTWEEFVTWIEFQRPAQVIWYYATEGEE